MYCKSSNDENPMNRPFLKPAPITPAAVHRQMMQMMPPMPSNFPDHSQYRLQSQDSQLGNLKRGMDGIDMYHEAPKFVRPPTDPSMNSQKNVRWFFNFLNLAIFFFFTFYLCLVVCLYVCLSDSGHTVQPRVRVNKFQHSIPLVKI